MAYQCHPGACRSPERPTPLHPDAAYAFNIALIEDRAFIALFFDTVLCTKVANLGFPQEPWVQCPDSTANLRFSRPKTIHLPMKSPATPLTPPFCLLPIPADAFQASFIGKP